MSLLHPTKFIFYMPNLPHPSLFRMLAVMFYDTLILLSVLFLASFIAVVGNNNEAISQGNVFFIIYLLAVSCLFYGWFWTHGGQTIGMRAWKVILLTKQGENINWRQAIIRFLIAIISWLPLGLGFWWQYLGQHKKNWPDKISGTSLFYNQNDKSVSISRLS